MIPRTPLLALLATAALNDCTADLCDNTPVNPPLALGTPCSRGVCDGEGACVECNEDADCKDPLTTCRANTCLPIDCRDAAQNGDETDIDGDGCSATCTIE